ncbi:hypothetical protein [Nocardioides sp. CER19]|uniref:hypothetical protein n=1 Tax=Nocardioides sp. CER19 TaxID=3038538 RepID=UPI00244C6294|nr:hypothetical protein [Nocardioides sp. CER19]MDH2413248.1 hypothetical protein [Nocardioides sp. CER19]
MTQHNPGKHAAAPTPRWLFLTQPDAARRGRDAGRRIAEAPVGATRRPRLAHLVPLGALLVATTGAVAVALPDDHAETPTTSAAKGTWRPPASPHVISSATVAAPAAYVTPPAGKHRAARPFDHAAATPAAAPTAASAVGRHRADVVRQEPKATSQPSAAPSTQHASSTKAATPASTPTKAAAPAPTTGGSGGSTGGSGGTGGSTGGLVGTVVGTVGGVVGGVVGGLVGGVVGGGNTNSQ